MFFFVSRLNSGPKFVNFLHFGWIFRVSPTEIISLSEMIWASIGPGHLTLSYGLTYTEISLFVLVVSELVLSHILVYCTFLRFPF